MSWSLRRALVAATLLGCLELSVRAQPPAKSEPAKKEAPRKAGLDGMKFPPGSILVLIEDLREALSQFPKAIILTPEKYQALQDQPAATESPPRKLAHACKMTGRLDGDFLVLRAEYTFSTEQPRTSVVLGLKGAHLADEGELDGQVPIIDTYEEGFLTRVDKEGDHRLSLNLRVPVELKKAGGNERSVELELPGTVVTTLELELPQGVKEIRWNDNAKAPRSGGRWQLVLGTAKKLALSWKEPVAAPAGGPLASVEGQLDVRLNETHVLINADLYLEDLRGQLKEWRLLLPAQLGEVTVKAPGGLGYDLVPPDGKNPYHLLRVHEPNSERWQVKAVQSTLRPPPGTRLPLGPFFVEGAFRQQGTIQVQAPAEVLHGQRLIYHKSGGIFQKDLPKTPASADVDAAFQYWDLPAPGKNLKAGAPKVPLELEIKNEKGQIETRTEHTLKVRPTAATWEVEITSRVQGKALLTAGDSLDVQLPVSRPHGAAVLALAPGVGFPAALPWVAWSETPGGVVGEFQAHEEGGGALELTSDAQGRARIGWRRSLGSKPFVAILSGKYQLPRSQHFLRVELPRPLGTLERECRISVQADEQVELLIGPGGAAEPVPERHRYQAILEQSPAVLELGWRPYQRDFAAQALIDVSVRERSAQVHQQLSFQVPARGEPATTVRNGMVRLLVPRGVRNLRVSGGKLAVTDAAGGVAWVVPDKGLTERQDWGLEYDVPLARAGESERTAPVPLLWPAGVTSKEAKVRVWGRPGSRIGVADNPLLESPWSDRGLELVPGRSGVPVLVVQGQGVDLPLALRLEEASVGGAALLCERGLIRVDIDEEGGQIYRARYLVQSAQAPDIDIEFPLAVAECRPSVKIGVTPVSLRDVAPWNVARVDLPPELLERPAILELAYRLPASFFEGKGPWRNALYAHRFKSPVVVGATRWQIALPPLQTGIVLGRNVSLDYRWGWQGWLLAPRPAQSAAEQESWLGAKDSQVAERDVSLTFERSGQALPQLYYLPRALWLLVCSGGVLLGGLALVFLPLPRALGWLLLALLSGGFIAVALFAPTLLPALAAGGQLGVLVFLVVLAGHWVLAERQRRQLTFMPGFTRAPKSSLSRGSSNRQREPSTVDAPTVDPLGAASGPRSGDLLP